MNYLVLDTSAGIRVLLTANGKNYDFSDENGKTASTVLLPTVDELLHLAGIDIGALDAIFAVVGPGSFTGIRIAVNTARMFSYVTKIPVYGIDTLCLGAYAADKKCTSIVYGWGKNFYVACYDENKKLISPAASATLDELSSLSGDIMCDSKTLEFIPKGKIYDVNVALRKAVEAKLVSGEKSDINSVVPFYIMPSQAERELDGKK